MTPEKNSFDDDGTLPIPEDLVDALKCLPSEKARLPSKVDALVMASARERMARVRRRAWIKRWSPALAAAACLGLAYLGISNSRENTKPAQASIAPAPIEDEAAIILREVELLFPGNIRAVTRDEQGLQIELSDEIRKEKPQAVVLELCKNGNCHEIITYDGQPIEIEGRTFTIHATKEGTVIFESDAGVWTSGEADQPIPNLTIRTRAI